MTVERRPRRFVRHCRLPHNAPEQPVYETLTALGIAFTRHEHPPVATAEEADRYWAGIEATHCKNLFLRNKKGDRHYLVVLEISKRADLKELVKVVGDDRLSFGSPERLMAKLGLSMSRRTDG